MTSDAPTIVRLTSASGGVDQDVAQLLEQLSSSLKPLSQSELEAVLSCPANCVFIARDKTGAACGMLTLVVLPLMSGCRGHIEDVVVDAAARGMGIGRALVTAALEEAERLGVVHVDLTSSPSKVAANAMYPQIGFVKRTTNVYRFVIEGRTPTGRRLHETLA